MNSKIYLPILTHTQKPLIVTTPPQDKSVPQTLQPPQAPRRRRKIFFKQKLMSVDPAMILRNRIPEEPGTTIILELIGRVVSILRTPTPTHPAIELLVRGEGQDPSGINSSGSKAPLRVEYWGGAKETEGNFSVLVGKLCRFIGTVATRSAGSEAKASERTFLAYWVIPDVPKSDLVMYTSELRKTIQFVSDKEI